MAFEFHHVVKNAANADHVNGRAVEQQMARSSDDALIGPGTIATVPQMKATDIVTKFGASDAAWSQWIGCDVT